MKAASMPILIRAANQAFASEKPALLSEISQEVTFFDTHVRKIWQHSATTL